MSLVDERVQEHHKQMDKHLRVVDDMLAESERREVAMTVKTKKKALKKRIKK